MSSPNRWILALTDRLSARSRKRRKILRDLMTLDDLKEVVALGSSLSQARRKALEETGAEPSREDTMEALRQCASLRFDNGLEAYRRLDDSARALIHDYADHHFAYKPEAKDIRSLAISGGGGKAQFYLGALRGLESQGVLKNIETFAGSSAGALCALPMAMGMGVQELDGLVRDSDFRSFFADSRRYKSPARSEAAFHTDIGVHFQALKQTPTPNISAVFAGLRFVAEVHRPTNDGEGAQGSATWYFCGEKVSCPVSFPLKQEDRLALSEALWGHARVRTFCRGIARHSTGIPEHESVLRRHFKDPKEVLDLMVTYALGHDGIEHYFGRIIERQLQAFVKGCSSRTLARIVPGKENPSLWPELTFEELGRLADSPEGRAFGFRHLVMGVTEESSLSWRGQFASSEAGKSTDPALAKLPIRAVARASMSLPLVFDGKRLAEKNYRDGGIRHNLPTAYFDRLDRGTEVLALIPFEGHAIRAAHTVQHGFRQTQRIPWDQDVRRWFDPGAQKNFWARVLGKIIAVPVNVLVVMGNSTYQRMGMRESFRNILIDTDTSGTLDFKVPEPVFDRINADAEMAVNGSEARPGLFDNNYNDCVALFDYKIRHYEATHPELVEEARAELDLTDPETSSLSGASRALAKMLGRGGRPKAVAWASSAPEL